MCTAKRRSGVFKISSSSGASMIPESESLIFWWRLTKLLAARKLDTGEHTLETAFFLDQTDGFGVHIRVLGGCKGGRGDGKRGGRKRWQENRQQNHAILRLSVCVCVCVCVCVLCYYLTRQQRTGVCDGSLWFPVNHNREWLSAQLSIYYLLWREYGNTYDYIPNLQKWGTVFFGFCLLPASTSTTEQSKPKHRVQK